MQVHAAKKSVAIRDSNHNLVVLLRYDHIEQDPYRGLILMHDSRFVAHVDGAVAEAVRAAQEAPWSAQF